jgi:addiction module HigA family antidote
MAEFHDGMPPIHPGEVLREEYLAPLGMTPNALATALHVTPNRINDIVLERRGITPDTAVRLARYFQCEPEFWLNMQQDYELKILLREHGPEIEHDITPLEFI